MSQITRELQSAGRGRLWHDRQVIFESPLPPFEGQRQLARLPDDEAGAREEITRLMISHKQGLALRQANARAWCRRRHRTLQDDYGLSPDCRLQGVVVETAKTWDEGHYRMAELRSPVSLDVEWAQGSRGSDLFQLGMLFQHEHQTRKVVLLLGPGEDLPEIVHDLLQRSDIEKVAFDWRLEDEGRLRTTFEHLPDFHVTSYGGSDKGGAETLLASVGLIVRKDQRTRRGNLAWRPLDKQVHYAALDVVLPLVYDQLLREARSDLASSGDHGDGAGDETTTAIMVRGPDSWRPLRGWMPLGDSDHGPLGRHGSHGPSSCPDELYALLAYEVRSDGTGDLHVWCAGVETTHRFGFWCAGTVCPSCKRDRRLWASKAPHLAGPACPACGPNRHGPDTCPMCFCEADPALDRLDRAEDRLFPVFWRHRGIVRLADEVSRRQPVVDLFEDGPGGEAKDTTYRLYLELRPRRSRGVSS